MKIAFCRESVLPAQGGPDLYLTELMQRLLADRHDVHVYASLFESLPPKVTVHPIAGAASGLLHEWRFGRACLRAVGTQYDVTVGVDRTWGQDVLYPLRGLERAAAEQAHRSARSGWHRPLLWLGRMLDPRTRTTAMVERRQYGGKRRPCIVVSSRMIADELQQHYAVSAQQIAVVRPAVAPGRFPEHDRLRRRQETRERWALGPSDVVALFAAEDTPMAGLQHLLYAVRRLREEPEFRDRADEFRLVVAGPSLSRSSERLAHHLGVATRVRFVGIVAERRDAYFASDLVVNPTAYDPCSTVVPEALACGLPVITTAADGACELLHAPEDSFVLDDSSDRDALARCLGKLLDPPRRHALTLAARKTAAAWTFEQHYQQFLAVLRDAAARKRAA